MVVSIYYKRSQLEKINCYLYHNVIYLNNEEAQNEIFFQVGAEIKN